MEIPNTQGISGNTALVLLSGGQDSTTCLYWALQEFERVEAIVFSTGRRKRGQ